MPNQNRIGQMSLFQELRERMRLRIRSRVNRESCWGEEVFQEQMREKEKSAIPKGLVTKLRGTHLFSCLKAGWDVGSG